MYKRKYFHLAVTSVLAVGSLLTGCSNKNEGAPEPPQTIGSAAGTQTQSTETPAPYTPESVASVITTCNIEAIDKASFQSEPVDASLSAKHSISGWIAAPELASPSYRLRLDDKSRGSYFQVKIEPRVKRPDVVAASNPPLPLESGFTLELPVNAVPAGHYHLYLVVLADGKFNVCDSGRQLHFK